LFVCAQRCLLTIDKSLYSIDFIKFSISLNIIKSLKEAKFTKVANCNKLIKLIASFKIFKAKKLSTFLIFFFCYNNLKRKQTQSLVYNNSLQRHYIFY